MHKQISMLRRQLAIYERERLQTNYDRIPKDLEYLTKSETELRKDLSLTLQSAQEAMEAQHHEISRLRREHFTNNHQIDGIKELQVG